VTTARERQPELASATRLARAAGRPLPDHASHRIDQTAHQLARGGREPARAAGRCAEAPARHADERTQAARSAGCLRGTAQGAPSERADDHLVRYLSAGRLQEELPGRIHVVGDALALQAGWAVTRATGRFGFGNRTYRVPRFDRLRAEHAGMGPG